MTLPLLAACGGDDDDGGTAAATTTATAAATGGGDNGGATATLNLSLTEYAIAPSPASIAAGSIRFVVANDGDLAHQLLIVKSDAAVDALSVEAGLVDESGVDGRGEIEPFDAGETETATFTLEAGRYLLICNIAGHYQLGMSVELTVNAPEG